MIFEFMMRFEKQRNMQTSKSDSQNIKSNHTEWYLLAEYALSEIMPDNVKGDELTAGFLSQPFQALGVPPEWIGKVEMTLTRLAILALVPVEQEKLARSGSIRLFCQRKMIDDANSVKTSSLYNEEQAMEHGPIKYHSSTIMNGGWGYFIIERSGDDAGSSERSSLLVDLYLYQEGE
jgi:hypothetical protein